MLINKRKLIQLFVSELHGERQYLEFKICVDLASLRGKASLAKVICGLANGNRDSRSYVVIGVEDGTRIVHGIDPIDDQRFQQLARNLLEPSPTILYENVILSGIEPRVVGLLTIFPISATVSISRDIWKFRAGDVFTRIGSETLHGGDAGSSALGLQEELLSLEARAASSLSAILEDVVQFHRDTHTAYRPRFLVFQDRHTLCFSGYPEIDEIEAEASAMLAGEGVKLFWGALQYVRFESTENSFTVTEHIPLFWDEKRVLVPIEKSIFRFLPDGRYIQNREFVFVAPDVKKEEILKLLEDYRADLSSYQRGNYKSQDAYPRFEIYAHELLVAALNGDSTAEEYLLHYLDGHVDGVVGEGRTEALRFLERISHNKGSL